MIVNDFYYNYINQKYPDSTLLFTNTDSPTYQIQTVNVYNDFYANNHLFEFSGYGKKSQFYNDENKKVIGKMKDSWKGKLLKSLLLFEGENVFIENKWRKNGEDKGSEEEEHSQEKH